MQLQGVLLGIILSGTCVWATFLGISIIWYMRISKVLQLILKIMPLTLSQVL